jgi:hypothetical protein
MTPLIPAAKTKLRDVLCPRVTRIDYLYDFGDSWEHGIIITKRRAGEPGVAYPRYVAGEHPAPPEDSGGVHGFYQMLETLAEPSDPNHDHIKQWLGDFDPEKFDPVPVQSRIAQFASRRKQSAKARAGKTRQKGGT